jgi:DNA-binding NtrC family response regulator
LKDRKEDIIPLAEYFLKDIAREYHKKVDGFEPDVHAALLKYGWPGNIRELRNSIERAVIVSSGNVVTRGDIHLEVAGDLPLQRFGALTYSEALRQFSNTMIDIALSQTGGNQTLAAQRLGVSRNFLIRQMKKYGINPFKYKK